MPAVAASTPQRDRPGVPARDGDQPRDTARDDLLEPAVRRRFGALSHGIHPRAGWELGDRRPRRRRGSTEAPRPASLDWPKPLQGETDARPPRPASTPCSRPARGARAGGLGRAEAAAPASPPVQVVEKLHAALLGVMKDAEELGYQGRYDRLAPVLKETYDTRLHGREVGRPSLEAGHRRRIRRSWSRPSRAS